MSMNDLLSDMITRIRNGQSASLAAVSAPYSNFLQNVLEVLKDEGYIRGYAPQDVGAGKRTLRIDLKYNDGEPVIRNIRRISTPGRRIYSAISKLQKVHNGLGVAVLSTPKGVLSDHNARIANVGGEVLFEVF